MEQVSSLSLTSELPDPHIWGKTVEDGSYYPLLAHMLDTAAIAGILWDHWFRPGIKDLLLEELGGSARSFFQLAAGIHDLGKCSPIFQGQMLSKQFARPEMQELLESRGFDFPSVADDRSYRLNRLHRHEKLGLYSLSGSVDKLEEDANNCWLELVVLGHHGSFEVSYGNRRNSQKPELDAILTTSWIDEQKKILGSLQEAVGSSLSEALAIDGVSDESIILLTGAVILADRLASSRISVEVAHKEMSEGKLSIYNPRDWIEKRTPLLSSLFEKEIGAAPELEARDILGNFQPRGIQKNIPTSRGLWLCMAPTGAGKTEAALLRHSQNRERLMFLLPTLSTTNAMMGRLLGVYESKPATTAVLGHGLAYLEDFYREKSRTGIDREQNDDCGLTPTEFYRVNGAKLSASINVATIDQLLMGSFPIKWSALRWVLMANSHIVIDEAHLLDHYQVELLSPILKLMGKTDGRVSILSATLPNWLENKFAESYSFKEAKKSKTTLFPSSLIVASSGKKILDSSIEVECYSSSIDLVESTATVASHSAWAQEMLELYPRARIGIFVNQVKRAQDIAQELRIRLPDDVEVLCLHSRMLAKHRKKVTDRLLRILKTGTGGGERIVLVGTQVIEMSLDIDLDLISTDLCPAPSLIQRMGRSWRDKKSEKRFDRIPRDRYPQMTTRVAIPLDSNGELKDKELLPYRQSVLLRTWQHLKGKAELNFPEDLQLFVETVLVDPASIESRGEEDEFADTIYRSMRGKDVVIDANFLSTKQVESLTLQQYGPRLTDSNMVSEEFATRLVEGPQGEPFVIRSPDPRIQDLGALDPSMDIDSTGFRRAQGASVGLNIRMSKELEKDESIEKLEIKDLRRWGYFGDLPVYLSYDVLTGLSMEDR